MSSLSKTIQFFEKVREIIDLADAHLRMEDNSTFPEKAATLLTSFNLHQFFNLDAVLLEALSRNFKISQKYPHFEFSDFPLTLVQGEHCFLDMYCWRRRPTSIHHHHFVGAFQCLEGKNLDWTYEFNDAKKIGDFHSLGRLSLKGKHALNPGDVVPIKWQEDFIHQNLHDADLTINICLRTHDRPGAYLADYLVSGLKTVKHPLMIQRVERLYHSLFLSSFQLSDLNLSTDEAIFFLTQTFQSNSRGSTFIKFRHDLHDKLMNEINLNIDQLCREHGNHLNNLE